MIRTKLLTENNLKDIKLYSARAISGATFLGGPLAGSYLVSQNFKSLNKPETGRNALLIGIISTVALFAGLFMIPEDIIDTIPTQLIPLFYTGAIWGIVEWKQGEILKTHKENNNPFFSGWRAFAVGFISLLIILIGIFGFVNLTPIDEIYEKYDAEMVQFFKNEDESLAFYEHLSTETPNALLRELDEKIIPKWKENIEIINNTYALGDLPSELKRQNKILLRYSELRIEAFELFRKAIEEDTDTYSQRLDQVHTDMEKEIKKL